MPAQWILFIITLIDGVIVINLFQLLPSLLCKHVILHEIPVSSFQPIVLDLLRVLLFKVIAFFRIWFHIVFARIWFLIIFVRIRSPQKVLLIPILIFFIFYFSEILDDLMIPSPVKFVWIFILLFEKGLFLYFFVEFICGPVPSENMDFALEQVGVLLR